MKKLFNLIICLSLFLFTSCAFGDDAPSDDSNWGVQPQKQSPKIAPSEKTWNEEQDETIYDNYGSEESPAYLNRENMNPNEADYDYGTADGVD